MQLYATHQYVRTSREICNDADHASELQGIHQEQVEKGSLAREVQAMIRHPTNDALGC